MTNSVPSPLTPDDLEHLRRNWDDGFTGGSWVPFNVPSLFATLDAEIALRKEAEQRAQRIEELGMAVARQADARVVEAEKVIEAARAKHCHMAPPSDERHRLCLCADWHCPVLSSLDAYDQFNRRTE